MSHSNTMEQTLLKSIDDYIDHGNSVYEMHQIAHYLNMQPSITSQIHAKFYVLLNEMDYTKIKKTLDLIEYLTVFSPPKIPQLVNDDKFMEYISQILMEHYLQDQTLNLLRLWADEYNDSREDLDKVFMLIENLEAFELQLPLSYHSQFKAAGAGVPAAAGNRPEQNAMMPEESGLSGKARDLINKSKEVIENMKKVLEAQNFEEMSREFKKNKLQLLLSQNLSASSDLSEQKTSETSSEVKQKIDTAIKELKSYRTKLQEKLDLVENKAGVAGPQNKAHQGPIQGPQNQPHNQPHHPPQNAADGYKIVVSATDNQGNAAQTGSQTMEVEELLNYKTQQCQEGAVCSHAPPQNVQVPMQTSYNSTMHCPCWHVREDRRRPVYDQMNRSVYNFGICANSQACPKGDSCGFSHNFFEHLYHPLNYKKKECIAGKGCRNGKYCPYYHSQEEKKAWNSIAKEYFDAAPDEENENLLEETNKHMREVSNWRDTVREEDYPSYNPNSDDDLEDYGYKKYKAPAAADLESNEPLKPSYGQGYVHDTNYNNEKAWYAKEEEKSGTLHSKLVIRKKYENPDILSKLFQKSTVFSGLPFCGQYGGMSGEKKVEGGEENKEKQN